MLFWKKLKNEINYFSLSTSRLPFSNSSIFLWFFFSFFLYFFPIFRWFICHVANCAAEFLLARHLHHFNEDAEYDIHIKNKSPFIVISFGMKSFGERGSRGVFFVRIRIQNKMCIELNSHSFTDQLHIPPKLSHPVSCGLPENTCIDQGQETSSASLATHTVNMNFAHRLVFAGGNKWIVLMKIIITAPELYVREAGPRRSMCIVCGQMNSRCN